MHLKALGEGGAGDAEPGTGGPVPVVVVDDALVGDGRVVAVHPRHLGQRGECDAGSIGGTNLILKSLFRLK